MCAGGWRCLAWVCSHSALLLALRWAGRAGSGCLFESSGPKMTPKLRLSAGEIRIWPITDVLNLQQLPWSGVYLQGKTGWSKSKSGGATTPNLLTALWQSGRVWKSNLPPLQGPRGQRISWRSPQRSWGSTGRWWRASTAAANRQNQGSTKAVNPARITEMELT